MVEHVRGMHEIRIQESTHKLQITFLTLISFEENLFVKLFLKNKKNDSFHVKYNFSSLIYEIVSKK